VRLDQFDQIQPSGEVLGVTPFVDQLALNRFYLHRDVEMQPTESAVVVL
jgi:hypothetical protein